MNGRTLAAVIACTVSGFFFGAWTTHNDSAVFRSQVDRLEQEAEYRDDVINDLIVEIDDLRGESTR